MCQLSSGLLFHLTLSLVVISTFNSYGMHTDWSTILSGSDLNGEHLLARTERSFGGNKIEPPSRPNSYWDDPHYRPYFDNSTEKNVTAQLGKTAYLHCRIRQLGDRTVGARESLDTKYMPERGSERDDIYSIIHDNQVSWVRQRDLHILTVGKYTYTSDQRFTSIHLDNSEIWTLEIKYTQKKDAGVYECQVSTEPKMSLSIRLNVVVSRAHIPEGPNLYIQSGSTINLTCIITESTSPPVFVFWYHDDRMINYDSSRGGIRVSTENGPTTVSRLRIQNARPTDSGNYSCQPSYADPANITVHVLNGEKPAAMQHGRSSVILPAPIPFHILLAVIISCLIRCVRR